MTATQMHGYSDVVVIPEGAARIRVTQNSHNNNPDDDNYLGKNSHNNNPDDDNYLGKSQQQP